MTRLSRRVPGDFFSALAKGIAGCAAIAGLAMILMAGPARSENPPRIIIIDSATQTEPLLAKPGTYLGEKFLYEDTHSGETLVRAGVWEAGPGKSAIEDFPFTEYVLMIGGSVIVTETNGTVNTFTAGNTFVIPRGWSGTWDVQQRMKKQIVRIGSSKP